MVQKYTITSSNSVTYLDENQIPVRGVIVRFEFGGMHKGEVQLSDADYQAGRAKELIRAHIQAMEDLQNDT